MNNAAPKRPTRQWRITVTEGAVPGLYLVGLTWRTFPCRASEWDGKRYSQFVAPEEPIGSADDLKAVLALAVEGEWYEEAHRARSRRT